MNPSDVLTHSSPVICRFLPTLRLNPAVSDVPIRTRLRVSAARRPDTLVRESVDSISADRLRVLCVGDDDGLLLTRHLVLESAGYVVRSIPSTGRMDEIELKRIDLAIICHSVSEERAALMAHRLRAINSKASILWLFRGFDAAVDDRGRVSMNGPSELIAQVRSILQK